MKPAHAKIIPAADIADEIAGAVALLAAHGGQHRRASVALRALAAGDVDGAVAALRPPAHHGTPVEILNRVRCRDAALAHVAGLLRPDVPERKLPRVMLEKLHRHQISPLASPAAVGTVEDAMDRVLAAGARIPQRHQLSRILKKQSGRSL